MDIFFIRSIIGYRPTLRKGKGKGREEEKAEEENSDDDDGSTNVKEHVSEKNILMSYNTSSTLTGNHMPTSPV